MDKLPNQERPRETPGLDGPDYFSLVIEFEPDAVSIEDVDAETIDEAGWDLIDEARAAETRAAEALAEAGWDLVDEAGDESFPASDPPSWGSAHAAPSWWTARISEPQVQAVEPVEPVQRARSRLGRILMALLALGTLFAVATRIRRRFPRTA